MRDSNAGSLNQAQRHCLHSARGLLLVALVYVTWRFGGVDVETRLHTSILLLVAGVLTLLGQPRIGFQTRRLPVLLSIVIALSVAWPLLQNVQLPTSVYRAVATGQHEIDANLVQRGFQATSEVLQSNVEHRMPRRSISVVRSLTTARTNQWILMAAFFLLSALLFDNRNRRNVFLWTLAINSGCLAIWGLIQRSTGTTDLLPGMTRSGVLLPFGPFIYKNAGAAALMPGLAATVGLLWARWIPRFGQPRPTTHPLSAKSNFGYRKSSSLSSQSAMILLLLSGISAAGLLLSYSRGAWLAAIVATIVVLFTVRKYVSITMASVLVGIPVLICLAIVAATSGLNPLADRIERQLSANYVYADARWQHWQDGFLTATKYFPLGSGLGTYGYATLAEQRSDSQLWFREAHNHYLETLTEQGLPGLLVLLLGGFLLIRYAAALLGNQISRERSAIGLVGLAAMVSIAVQSMFDFVILIPAVMFLFASLLGIVAQAYVSPLGNRTVRTTADDGKPELRSAPTWISMPAVWMIPSFICLSVTQFSLRDELRIDQVLTMTRPIPDAVPDPLLIEANLDWLNECITANPRQAELFKRRSEWYTIQLRFALRDASEQSGNSMDWLSTSPAVVFEKMLSLPEAKRLMLLDDFAIHPDIKRLLRRALSDSLNSLNLNPFDPTVNLSATYLATFVGLDGQPFIENLSRLAHSNPRLQFTTGLIGYSTGDYDLMVDQWRRSLRSHVPEFPDLVRLCRQSLSVDELMTRLIPDNRSAWLLPMVGALDELDLEQLRSDQNLIAMMERRIYSDPTQTAAQQQALLGWIWTELDQPERRVQHWKAALEADRANTNYRFQYCQALLKTGDYVEVLKQSALGLALDPDGDRFKQLADTARLKLRTRSGRRSDTKRF